MTTRGTIGFKGYQPAGSGNELTSGPGALLEADHVVSPAAAKVRSRRGFATLLFNSLRYYIDNDSTDAAGNRVEALYQWATHLLVNYDGSGGGKLASFSNVYSSVSWALLGSFSPPALATQRMKFAELAKSLFFTTSAGLYVVDSVTGTPRAAGLTEPLIYLFDPDGGIGTRLSGNPSASGSWFAKNQTVAGRGVCGKKDANGRVILSAPSGRAVVVNPADVVVPIGQLARVGTTCTATVGSHKLRVGDVFDLSPGEANFPTGNKTVTSVGSASIVYTEAGAAVGSAVEQTFSSKTKSIQWSVRLTADMVAGDFVRIYRTDEAPGEAIDPGDECFLSYERTLTSTDISNGYVLVVDTTPSSFLSEQLPTNANTGKGPKLGRAERPPLAADVCMWNGRLWAADTIDRHRLSLRLLGTGSPNGLQLNDLLAVNCRVYRVGTEAAPGGTEFTAYTSYLPTENVDKTTWFAVAVIRAQQANTGLTAFQRFDGDTGLGEVLLEQLVPASSLVDGSSGAVSAVYAATSRTSAFGDRLAETKAVTAASTARTLGTTVTVRCTGHGFVAGQLVMLAYAHGVGAPDANFPVGLKTVATVVDANNFTYTESGSNATLSGAVPYYAYATTFKSDDNRKALRCSEEGLPESWPLPYAIDRLPARSNPLRIHPTPDGGELLVCLDSSDIYAVSGSYPFSVRRVDGSAQLVAADSLVEHGNRLYALTTQGPATIGSVGVGRIGGDIEEEWRDLVLNVANFSLRAEVWAMSYESAGLWLLFVPSGSSGPADRCLAYDSFKGTWSRFTSIKRSHGLVLKGSDVAVWGNGDAALTRGNQLLFQRKFASTSHLSYAEGLYGTTVNGNQSSVSTVAVNAGAPFAAGDYVDFGQTGTTFYRITGGNGTTSMSIDGTVSVTNGQAVVVYRAIPQTITFAVDTGQMPGIEKKLRELQLHFGRRHVRTFTVNFVSEHSSSSSPVTVTPSDFVFGTPVTGVSTVRVEVPEACRMAAMLTVTVSVSEAFMFFDLLGYSLTGATVSEKTGR